MRKTNIKRSYYEPNRNSYADYNNNLELRSLQCSSVEEANPTNESYEMSWLEKLVGNIDKNCEQEKRAGSAYQIEQRRSGSTYQYQQRKGISTYSAPFVKKEYKRAENYGVSDGDWKRKSSLPFADIYSSSYKRQDETKSTYLNNERQKARNNTEVNDSFGSYGKIKRGVKKSLQNPTYLQKYNYEETSSKPSSKYPINTQSRFQNSSESNSIITFNNGNEKSFTSSEMAKSRPSSFVKEPEYSSLLNSNAYPRHSRQQDRVSKSTSQGSFNSKSYNGSAGKYSSSKYAEDIPRSPSIGSSLYNYEKYSTQAETLGDYNQKRRSISVNAYTNNPPLKNPQKQKEDEEIKMEEMAKRLNKVLENISEKSKRLSIGQPAPKQPAQSIKQIQGKEKDVQSLQKYSPSPYNSEKAIKSYEPKLSYQHKKSYEHQKRPQRIQSHVQEFKSEEYHQKKPQKFQRSTNQSKYSYSKYVQENISKYSVHKTSLPNSTPAYKPKENNQHTKYQHMKRSLGASKHVPSVIILEESSSEIASEISPRSDFLNQEFKRIFKILDVAESGQLSKNNCAVQKIHEQLKYLFGGILSKIRYKNQKYNLKEFSAQCEKVSKEFVLCELKQIFSKAAGHKKTDSLISFKFAQKQVESLRYGAQTNNGNQSKRSSDCSEVVKKYQFAHEEDLDFGNQANFRKESISNKNNSSQPHFSKVHWAAPQEAQVQLLDIQNIRKENPKKYETDFTLTKKLNENRSSHLNTECKQNLKARSTSLISKQNKVEAPMKSFQKEPPRRDFERLCENLNNKLNKYLTTMNSSSMNPVPSASASYSPKISLEFSELHKHWNLRRP